MRTTTPTGTILFAHGSRDPLWRQPIEAVAQQMRASTPAYPVRCAYLELCTPDIFDSATELIACGVGTIIVVPLFLGMGKHTREDLPQLMAKLQSQHPAVRFVLKPAIGEEPRLIALLAQLAMNP
jgi:sirohydrochlorin cobaltochelatase